MNENEYMDETKWSDEELVEISLFKDKPFMGEKTKEAIKAAFLKRMSTAPQEGDWEERELRNEIMQEGDIIHYIDGYSEPVRKHLFGKKSDIYSGKVTRRVPKKKPQPEEPKIKFAIAGTKEAELPGVVVLELVHGWLNPEKIYLHCKDYSSGYLLGINMYTGKVNRVPGVGESFGFTLGDWGKLVIE